jgi:N-acetylmuramoyl-L-alanine amidase
MYIVLDRKKCTLICGGFLALGLIFGGVFKIMPNKNAFKSSPKADVKVLIDAGHGGPDGGTVGSGGTIEADINLDVAQKICEILRGKGIEASMTRCGRDGVKPEKADGWSKLLDMRERLKIMKKSNADLFLSIHMNHFTQKSVSGLRVFYAANHKEIKPLAEKMQDRMSELTGAKVSAVRAADKGLLLMKSPPMPAILAECGFLSNPDEEKKLATDEYRAKLAWAIAEAIEEHFREKS